MGKIRLVMFIYLCNLSSVKNHSVTQMGCRWGIVNRPHRNFRRGFSLPLPLPGYAHCSSTGNCLVTLTRLLILLTETYKRDKSLPPEEPGARATSIQRFSCYSSECRLHCGSKHKDFSTYRRCRGTLWLLYYHACQHQKNGLCKW